MARIRCRNLINNFLVQIREGLGFHPSQAFLRANLQTDPVDLRLHVSVRLEELFENRALLEVLARQPFIEAEA